MAKSKLGTDPILASNLQSKQILLVGWHRSREPQLSSWKFRSSENIVVGLSNRLLRVQVFQRIWYRIGIRLHFNLHQPITHWLYDRLQCETIQHPRILGAACGSKQGSQILLSGVLSELASAHQNQEHKNFWDQADCVVRGDERNRVVLGNLRYLQTSYNESLPSYRGHPTLRFRPVVGGSTVQPCFEEHPRITQSSNPAVEYDIRGFFVLVWCRSVSGELSVSSPPIWLGRT